MEKLEFLRKYAANIEIIAFSDLTPAEKAKMPLYLSAAFKETDTEAKLKRILAEWEKYTYQFQSTILYLREKLVDIEVIKKGSEISTLYSIKNAAGETVYYEGKLPLTRDEYEAKQPLWNKLRRNIREVYENLHNGWYYFASQSMGISPVENILNLADEDWGILEEIDVNSLPFKLKNCLGIFHNGMGDYVCVDVDSKDEKSGFIWWHTKAPKLDIEFWGVVDEWTKMGIEK